MYASFQYGRIRPPTHRRPNLPPGASPPRKGGIRSPFRNGGRSPSGISKKMHSFFPFPRTCTFSFSHCLNRHAWTCREFSSLSFRGSDFSPHRPFFSLTRVHGFSWKSKQGQRSALFLSFPPLSGRNSTRLPSPHDPLLLPLLLSAKRSFLPLFSTVGSGRSLSLLDPTSSPLQRVSAEYLNRLRLELTPRFPSSAACNLAFPCSPFSTLQLFLFLFPDTRYVSAAASRLAQIGLHPYNP